MILLSLALGGCTDSTGAVGGDTGADVDAFDTESTVDDFGSTPRDSVGDAEIGEADLGPDSIGTDEQLELPWGTVDSDPMSGTDSVEILNYPVVVVGAGTGGTMAAIQAGRLGVRVALVEETDWVGGQMAAAAVSTLDEGNSNIDSGLYKEFWTRAKTHYTSVGKSMATCYFGNGVRCIEASVARKILLDMIDGEPNIHLFLRTHLESTAVSSGGQFPVVTGITVKQTNGGSCEKLIFESQVVIDATEYGDVLPLAGVPFRLANRTSDALDPDACVQDITYTAVIKHYQDGVPPPLTLTVAPPGYNDSMESQFAAFVTANGHDWRSSLGQYPVNWPTHSSYRGVPDSARPGNYPPGAWEAITRTGVNWANDHPYTTAAFMDAAHRREVNCAAKVRTLQFLYYVQTVLGHTDWSVADDEGFNTPFNAEENSCPEIPEQFKEIEKNLPQIPYVRESRRIIGLETLTGADIKRVGSPPAAQKTFRSAVAVGDYAVDLHNCSDGPDLEADLESAQDVPLGFLHGPFQVPFEVFVPQAVDGLVAAEKNLSLSRLASGACRLQPITMLTGQAAGTIAALSVQRGVQPRFVKPVLVQSALADAGSRLTLTEYSDVARGASAWSDVQIAAVHEVMNGDGEGRFRPSDPLSRAEGAAVTVRLLGLPLSTPTTPTFSDVKPTDWFFPYVEALQAAGLANSCPDEATKYCPEMIQNRSGFATAIARGLGLDLSSPPVVGSWADVPSTDTSFAEVEALTKLGLLNPCTTSASHFCPEAPLIRSEAAGLVARSLVHLAQ